SYEMIVHILGIAICILVMSLLDNYCHLPMLHKKDQQAWQSFLFLSFAILFHNIPSGFALGTAFINHAASAIPFLIAIVVHHIPEGIALIIPFLFRKHKYIS
ncbi:ZIP family metal transporter, partial [Bacillus cereus group sp. N17]|uniref:ZIP family metal transporter n=1 Tax=Bacillus cereus group sp. N17 TaxID=2794589 RepID=UPI0018F5B4F9